MFQLSTFSFRKKDLIAIIFNATEPKFNKVQQILLFNMKQTTLFKDLQNLKEEDWFKNPSEWRISQWYIIGTFITDFSLCSGVYAKRWASELKILNSDAEYLICGNKDELIILFEYLCKNNKLPLEDYLIFKVLGNKVYNRVEDRKSVV